ncbi:class I SAM-dependent methyltransferase [Brevibacillus daliensis]|uniref:class I SAM-dependent methyltransferase n=1 Tax=Brevibacillus daliensis TaxID=2892995 RepID=UPI001E4E64D4|nr:class I SAM-dependent methyltransferase [Brevibacillus daliensis]
MVSEWNKHVQQEWDIFASNWQEKSEEMWERGSRKTILPLFTKLLPPSGQAVLDAGCGAGYASRKLARLGYLVDGLDISGEMVQLARKDSADIPPSTLHFTQGDIAELPYSSDHFSGIISINAMEFSSSPLRVLREFYRVLQPDGILLLAVLGPTAGPRAHSYPRLYDQMAIQNTIMPWEAKRLAHEIGFILTSEEHVYKDGVKQELVSTLSIELQESLTFNTLLMLKKPLP